MVALLLYAYARGVRSSRGIERACVEDVAFRVVARSWRSVQRSEARLSPKALNCA
ncbi:MAG: transposase [Solirubrobacteraceae bacterium]